MCRALNVLVLLPVLSTIALAQQPARAKFDYRVELVACEVDAGYCSRDSRYNGLALDSAKVAAKLTTIGADGWELSTMYPAAGQYLVGGLVYQGTGFVAVFKRSDRDVVLAAAARDVRAAKADVETANKELTAAKDAALKAINADLATTVAHDVDVMAAVAKAMDNSRLKLIEDRLTRLESPRP